MHSVKRNTKVMQKQQKKEEGRSAKKRNRSDQLSKSGKEIPFTIQTTMAQRDLHDNVFNALNVFIDEHVIVKKEVHLLSDIL